MAIIVLFGLVVASCLLIWRASAGFEVASDYLGRNLSDGVKGATINAIGSSLPEILTTMFFLLFLKQEDGFAGGIGTTAGSAIFNSMIIPTLVMLMVVWLGIAQKIKLTRRVVLRDGVSLILAETILLFSLFSPKLEWWHGAIMMGTYGIYMVYMFATMSRNTNPLSGENFTYEGEVPSSRTRALLTLDLEGLILKGTISGSLAWRLLGVSVIIIAAASAVLVEVCEQLGAALGVKVYFVAVIVASAATSIPDLFLSLRDSRKGNYDDALSNALGSNIFDICFALGFPLFLYTLLYGPIELTPATHDSVNELRLLLLFLTVGAFLVFYLGEYMTLAKALMLGGLYGIFSLYIFGSAYQWKWAMEASEGLQMIIDLISLPKSD
ncbi:MAG: sodium:calcium antiporter [Bacteroidota bacterium]